MNSGIRHTIYFIADGNQDCIDDNTGKTADILSMRRNGSCETRTNWTTDMMDIRGGNIVYVYDNYTNGLFYYAPERCLRKGR